jgi:hypothetical protein
MVISKSLFTWGLCTLGTGWLVPARPARACRRVLFNASNPFIYRSLHRMRQCLNCNEIQALPHYRTDLTSRLQSDPSKQYTTPPFTSFSGRSLD